jgi:UTP:GlnB (protein PII) uridylyltransferase
MEEKMVEKVKELNLLLMLLTGWEEDSRKNPGEKIFRAWKGYLFETLNQLADDKLIIQFQNTKSVMLTDAGRQKAEELKKRFIN